MTTVAIGALEIAGACIWLLLLVITQFNPFTVSLGLLGGLYLMGRSGKDKATR